MFKGKKQVMRKTYILGNTILVVEGIGLVVFLLECIPSPPSEASLPFPLLIFWIVIVENEGIRKNI